MVLVQFDVHGDDPICRTAYSATTLKRVAGLGTAQDPHRPRGMTLLFDAVGHAIAATEGVAGGYDHVVVVI